MNHTEQQSSFMSNNFRDNSNYYPHYRIIRMMVMDITIQNLLEPINVHFDMKQKYIQIPVNIDQIILIGHINKIIIKDYVIIVEDLIMLKQIVHQWSNKNPVQRQQSFS